jgi:hypothetical protein
MQLLSEMLSLIEPYDFNPNEDFKILKRSKCLFEDMNFGFKTMMDWAFKYFGLKSIWTYEKL